MERIKWLAAQLLPFKWWSHFTDNEGRHHFCVWRMWFGRSFWIHDRIAEFACFDPSEWDNKLGGDTGAIVAEKSDDES